MIFEIVDEPKKRKLKKPLRKPNRKPGEGRENFKPIEPNEHTTALRQTGRPNYWTEEKINEEAEYLMQWAMNEDSLSLGKCYGSRYYSYVDANEWEQKYDIFRKAKRFATTIITARREEGGLLGKLDSAIVRSTHGTYDLDHRAYLKEMKEVMQGVSHGPVTVQIKNYRDSDASTSV
jgi:hypothetical protein